MLPRLHTRLSHGRAYVFALVAVAFVGWGLYAATDALLPPKSVHVRMGAGSSVARRFQIAETLAREARRRDLFADVIATKGFEDSICQISDGKLDVAVVSTGLQISACKDARILAGLDIAPLHILVRNELAKEGAPLSEMMKGRTVNVGEPGTNDYLLANDVIRFLRLSPIDADGQGDYRESKLSKDELSQLAAEIQSQSGPGRQARARELPDVVMTVVTLPSLLVQSLIDTGEYCLVPFPNLDPFLLSDLQHSGPDVSVDRVFLEPTTIHKGMYLGSSLIPTRDCPAVGLRTLLVARADLPTATVKRVMQCVFETDFMRRVDPISPREFASPYQIHPAAEAYLDRDKPLITGSFFEFVSKILSIFGAFSAGALSFYGYLRRRRIRRPGDYLDEIRKIDALASGQQPDGDVPLAPGVLAQQLDTRLTQLKEQVISDYCSNRVPGEMTLLSILSILADSRTQLRGSPGRPVFAEAAAATQTVPEWPVVGASSAQGTERTSGKAA
jgi:hypothetical protein